MWKYVTYEYCPVCHERVHFTEVNNIPEEYYYEDEPIDEYRFFCLGVADKPCSLHEVS